jgi:hypothetical protein
MSPHIWRVRVGSLELPLADEVCCSGSLGGFFFAAFLAALG